MSKSWNKEKRTKRNHGRIQAQSSSFSTWFVQGNSTNLNSWFVHRGKKKISKPQTHFQLWNVGMNFWSCLQCKFIFNCSKIPLQGLSASNRGFSGLRAAPKAPVGSWGQQQPQEEQEEKLGVVFVFGSQQSPGIRFYLGRAQASLFSFSLCPLHISVTLKTQDGGAQAGLEAAPPSLFQALSFFQGFQLWMDPVDDGSLRLKVKFCRLWAPPAHARISCHPTFQNSH